MTQRRRRPVYGRENVPEAGRDPFGEPQADAAPDMMPPEEETPYVSGPEDEPIPEDAYDPEEEYEVGAEDPKEPAAESNSLKEQRSIFKPRTKKPAFILSVLVNVIRALVLLVILAGLAGAGAVAGIAKGYVETAPDLDLAAMENQAQTSFIYDANGQLITEYKGSENRIMVSIQAMPVTLQHAFIAVEDARFYTHSGVDLKRIAGAFLSNLSSTSMQGGSTITQQLIKNTVLSSEQSYKRKIQEAYLAMQLEARYTKEEILECYLNTIWLGESYYGVQVAAEGYFGKPLDRLTLRECAMLAGICNSPYYYNPRRNFYTRSKEGVDYPGITNNRTDYVLYRMYQCQFITYEQYQSALNPATAQVLRESPTSGDSMYPYAHYVEYAVSEVVDIFLELEGLENTGSNRAAMENKLRTGGYRVQLALDPSIQENVQETLAKWTKYPSLRDPSDKVFRSSNGDGTYTEIVEPQAAAVVLDYRTGELKAIVGSRTEPTVRKTLNRATDMRMPVGSAIKPLTVYAPALAAGCSPASIAYNMPVPISGWTTSGKETWPRNYGGGGYTGPEDLRSAMKHSHNTAAAYVLMNYVGIERAVNYLHLMGVDDSHIDATPFGLSLGSSGITPMQMAVAYGVLANYGIYQKPISVIGISDSEGHVVWDGHQHQDRRRVFPESTAYLVVDMLKSVVSSGTGSSAAVSGQITAGKTGTNSDQKGVFFAGMTGYYSSALWIGHDNYKALSGKSTGSGAAAPLWKAYMDKIHKGMSKKDIMDGDPSQYNLIRVTTCAISGQLATDACRTAGDGSGTITDWWDASTAPTVYCQMHITQNVCAESGLLSSGYCPNVVSKGVAVIPNGHPLYRFIGTEYESVLTEYLGPWATTTYNSSGQPLGRLVCTLHTHAVQNEEEQTNPMVTNTLIPDAQQLLSLARGMLGAMNPSSQRYGDLNAAIANLEAVIAKPNPSLTEVAAAMAAVNQAMSN